MEVHPKHLHFGIQVDIARGKQDSLAVWKEHLLRRRVWQRLVVRFGHSFGETGLAYIVSYEIKADRHA